MDLKFLGGNPSQCVPSLLENGTGKVKKKDSLWYQADCATLSKFTSPSLTVIICTVTTVDSACLMVWVEYLNVEVNRNVHLSCVLFSIISQGYMLRSVITGTYSKGMFSFLSNCLIYC